VALLLVGLALVAVVLVLALRAGRATALHHAGSISEYFGDAVRVFSFTGEEAAHSAALAAGKTAAGEQRASMVTYLQALTSDWISAAGDDPEAQVAVRRLDQVAHEIAAKDWTMGDVIAAKRHLKALDGEYYHALGTADPSVFRRRFPMFFT
jgi:hypothetical protein